MDQEMNEDKVPVCPGCDGCSGDAPSVPAADAAAECPAEKEPAPTYEEVREAYDRLEKLVEAYGDQAILQLVINNGEDGDFLHTCSPSTSSASGKSSRLFAWGAARWVYDACPPVPQSQCRGYRRGREVPDSRIQGGEEGSAGGFAGRAFRQ